MTISSIDFLYPEVFFLLCIPILIFLYQKYANKNSIDHIFSKEVLKKIKLSNSMNSTFRKTVFLTALVLIIIALSKPVITSGKIDIKSKSIDVIVAFDISKSMLSSDIFPSRIEAAKLKFKRFIKSSKNLKIALIGFAKNSFLISPLSRDTASISYLADNLNSDYITQSGTSILSALESANRLSKKEKKALIIFSDGGENTNFEKEIAYANKHNIVVYIYAIGTTKGGTIEVDGNTIKDKHGNIAIVKLNKNIKTLSENTGGAYLEYSFQKNDIDQFYKHIKNNFKSKIDKSKQVKNHKQLFYYPLILAILFIFLYFNSLTFRKKDLLKKNLILFALLLSYHKPLYSGVLDFIDIKHAKDAYNTENYKKAIDIYQKLDTKDPKKEYNIANSYYKNKQFNKALKTYQKINTKDDQKLQFNTLFNKANTNMQLKKYENAIEEYENAIKIKKDEDAKSNLQLAKRLLKKQKKDQQKKSDKKKDQQKQQNKDNKQQKKQNSNQDNNKNKKQEQKKDQQKKSDKQKNKQQEKKKQQKQNSNQDNNRTKDKEQKPNPKEQKDINKTKKQKDQNTTKDKNENNASTAKQIRKVPISDKEEKRWLKKMNKNNNILLYPMQKPQNTQKENNENPW